MDIRLKALSATRDGSTQKIEIGLDELVEFEDSTIYFNLNSIIGGDRTIKISIIKESGKKYLMVDTVENQ